MNTDIIKTQLFHKMKYNLRDIGGHIMFFFVAWKTSQNYL